MDSGVVGRERRSHRRNFERYIFIIAIKLAIFHCYYVTAFRASQPMSKTRHQNLQSISALKLTNFL